MIITIDGLSGVGKSTVAKAVADELGFFYINTGRIYRSLAYNILTAEDVLEDRTSMSSYINDLDLVFLNNMLIAYGLENESVLQNEEIAGFAAEIGADLSLKRAISKKIIRMIGSKNAVIEGRMSGTILFPNADLKVYLYANVEKRVNRKLSQMSKYTYDSLKDNLELRDILVTPILGENTYKINTSGKPSQVVIREILNKFRTISEF